jgi:RNA polymerase subunit RPABC4/transcription elongation factor Spt4
MSNRKCPVCGATWISEQLYWATGKTGRDEDLNALVCRRLTTEKAERCVNPVKGKDGGIGWEEREKMLEQGLDGL